MTNIAQAASLLAARRRTGITGPLLPDHLRPQDIASALAIQAGVIEQLGEQAGGWKCGLNADPPVIMAPIHAGTIHTAGSCTVWTEAGQVRIEPELAFILGHDLPARNTPYSPAEVDAAVARIHLALELIGSRYDDPASAGYLDNLADGLLNQGMLLGPEIAGDAVETLEIRIRMEEGAEQVLDGKHPNGDPRAPLYWLVEFLRGRGTGLRKGQAVITGSFAGSILVPVEQDIAIRFGERGEIAVRFTSNAG
ncbi:hypothetical protein AYR66_25780 [Noviherbaspirillum denitrificans]|uniref:Fumarylacetoacetase-like C-terminal domain-containing protein n=2 Tax=Noviherbaspirillum denitrificans TaxID=1968433 RepID=A0A254TJM5_9BURK|nr:hypothetical protein AYR66_25780 [Noviherbaspirillum denitrificans]